MLGSKLRALRESKSLTLDAVASESRRVAERFNIPALALDTGWLSRIEREEHDLSTMKLTALCLIYKVAPSTLIEMMLSSATKNCRGPHTTILDDGCLIGEKTDRAIFMPSRVRCNEDMLETCLLAEMVEAWNHISYADIPSSAASYYQLGFVGRSDFTMWPLVSPGALLTIDKRQRVVTAERRWASEQQRPIYFFELRGRHAYGWCEISSDKRWLSIVSHPLSPANVVRFRFPEDIGIVGRVVSLSMSLNTKLPLPVARVVGIKDAR